MVNHLKFSVSLVILRPGEKADSVIAERLMSGNLIKLRKFARLRTCENANVGV